MYGSPSGTQGDTSLGLASCHSLGHSRNQRPDRVRVLAGNLLPVLSASLTWVSILDSDVMREVAAVSEHLSKYSPSWKNIKETCHSMVD